MGRFFKATPTSFLDDAMYQHPTDLMQKALMTKEKSAQNRLVLMKGVDDELEVNPHAKDRDNAIQIRDKIDKQKEDLIQDFYKNPDMDATRRSKLMNLQKEVKNQMSTGEIAQFNKNNKAIQARKKALGEQYDKNPEKFRAFSSRQEVMDQIDYEYQGGVDEEGNLLEPTSFSLAESNETIKDVQNALGKKTGKDFTGVANIDGLKQKYSMEGFSNEEIENTMQSYVRSSDKIQNAIQQEYRVRNQSEDVSRQQVENEYYSRLVDTARQQFGKEMTKKVPVNGKNSGGPSEDKIDTGNIASGLENVSNINSHFKYGMKMAEERAGDADNFSKSNTALNFARKHMQTEINGLQNRLKNNIKTSVGDDFEGQVFDKDGNITDEAIKAVNNNIVDGSQDKIDQFIMQNNAINLKKVQSRKLFKDKGEYFKNMFTQIDQLESDIEKAKTNGNAKKVEELEKDLDKARKPIETNSVVTYSLGKELNGDNWKNLQNDKDNYRSTKVIIPDVGTLSKAGEPGTTMKLGDVIDNLKESNAKLFKEKTTTYKNVKEVITKDEKTVVERTNDKGETIQEEYDNPSVKIEKVDEGIYTVIEDPELEISEKNRVAANKIANKNAVFTELKIGNKETLRLTVDADANALLSNKAKEKLNESRKLNSGYLKMQEIVSGEVVDDKSGTPKVNSALRNISGKVSLGGEEVNVKIDKEGNVNIEGSDSSDGQLSKKDTIENILNLLMKDKDTVFSSPDK